jgi:uncharacterized protein (TIGR02145 family)
MGFVAIALGMACSASCQRRSANTMSRQMADGKQWTTHNLNVETAPSYCYENAELNCRQYGRLYTWESAQRGCQSLGDGWRLPTDDEWRQMAKHYGGVSQDSDDKGKVAYQALLAGGRSGFNALLGGGRGDDGRYARLEAHGFYWTGVGERSGRRILLQLWSRRASAPSSNRRREAERFFGPVYPGVTLDPRPLRPAGTPQCRDPWAAVPRR